MSIAVQCGSCGKDYTVKDDAAGKKFKCKDCGDVVEVPVAAGAMADDEFGGLDGDLEDGDVAGTGRDLPAASGRRRRSGGRNRVDALGRVSGPALSLMIVAGISIGLRVLGLVLSAVGVALIPQMVQQGGANDGVAIGQLIGGILGNLVALLLTSPHSPAQ